MFKTIKDENRRKLIEEVQRLGNSWELTAQNDALKSARYPGNQSLREAANRSVSIYDAVLKTSNEIIDRINAYWPREEESKNDSNINLNRT